MFDAGDLVIGSAQPSADTPPTPLSPAQFHQLADVPPALTWFANIDTPETRRAYQNDVQEFIAFAGIANPDAFRQVGRTQILARRRDLEHRRLAPATVRRKLAALSLLFESLCEAMLSTAIQSTAWSGRKMTAMKTIRRRSAPPGARTAGDAGHLPAAEAARSRDASHAAVRRPTMRRAVRTALGRRARPPRRAPPAGPRQRLKNPLCAIAPDRGRWDRRLFRGGRPRRPSGGAAVPARQQQRPRSRRMASTACWPSTPAWSGSTSLASVRMRCAPPPSPMRSTTTQIWLRCRSESDVRTSRPCVWTTVARRAQKNAQRSRFPVKSIGFNMSFSK